MHSSMLWPETRVLVTGGAGFVGRRVVEQLRQRGRREVCVPRSQDYNLVEGAAVRRLLHDARPQVVIHLAAKVGGIGANRHQPASFFYDNLMMGAQLMHESWCAGPALIRKFVEARERGLATVQVWGTGRATREFLYVDDAAEGIILATERYDNPEPVNLGSGMEVSIGELATLVAEITGFKGEIVFDTSQPDGQPRRRLDTSLAESSFGFRARTPFLEGLRQTIEWYLAAREPHTEVIPA